MGRTDIKQYNQALEHAENFIIFPQGGVSRRPGTLFIMDTAKPDGTYHENVRLIPFSASDGTRYQLVIASEMPEVQTVAGEYHYAWFAINVATNAVEDIVPYYNSTPFGVFATSPTTGEWSTANMSAIDLNEIQYAQAGDMIFLVHPNLYPMRIAYNLDGASGFILHPFPNPYIYAGENTSTRSMVFDEEQTDLGVLYQITVTAPSITPGAPVTLVGSGFASNINFDSTYLNRMFKFSKANNTLLVLITSVTDSLNAGGIVIIGAITVSPTNFGLDTTSSYAEGIWNSVSEFPRTVCFFEARLVFGGNLTYPDTIWFSQQNDIFEFDSVGLDQDAGAAAAVVATDPFSTTLNSEVLNQLRWVSPGKSITTGTNSREFAVQGPSTSASIGPTNIQSSAESAQGSAYVQALRVENIAAFLHRDKKRVYELVYNFTEDSFKPSNLSILAEHMAGKPLGDRDGQYTEFSTCNYVAMVMQTSPGNIIWLLDNNGYLTGVTRERQQEITAWHRHKLAGTFQLDGLDFDPLVQSISVVQTPIGVETQLGAEVDELWMAVTRVTSELDGSGNDVAQKRVFIEKLGFDWGRPEITNGWVSTGDLRHGPVYCDCAVIRSSADADPDFPGYISELNHGNGSTVVAIVNGIYLGEFVVADGTINIETELTDLGLLGGTWEAIVGYNYLAELVPVVPEVPAQIGSSMGQPRRIDQITINFYRSMGVRFGRQTDEYQDNTPQDGLEEIVPATAPDATSPVPLFTGDVNKSFPPGYESRPRIRIQSHLPFPVTITHIVTRMVVYEK